MTGLGNAERVRLAKLLAMLGSDHAGERDAAGLAAHRLVQQAGLTWQQVLNLSPDGQQRPRLQAWHATVAECLARPGSLKPWEHGFLRDLRQFRRLSPRQAAILREIAERVGARAAA